MTEIIQFDPSKRRKTTETATADREPNVADQRVLEAAERFENYLQAYEVAMKMREIAVAGFREADRSGDIASCTSTARDELRRLRLLYPEDFDEVIRASLSEG